MYYSNVIRQVAVAMRPLAVSGAATCLVSGRLWNDLPPGLQSPGLHDLRLLPTSSAISSIWRPKRLVTLLNLQALYK